MTDEQFIAEAQDWMRRAAESLSLLQGYMTVPSAKLALENFIERMPKRD